MKDDADNEVQSLDDFTKKLRSAAARGLISVKDAGRLTEEYARLLDSKENDI